jgi:hypothetical protein
LTLLAVVFEIFLGQVGNPTATPSLNVFEPLTFTLNEGKKGFKIIYSTQSPSKS